MKFLRNPIVTGLLVLAAVGMVFYQIYAPRWERARARVPQPVAAAVAAVARVIAPSPVPAPTPAPAENPALADFVPDNTIDRRYAESHFEAWVESPARDPFLLLGVQPPEVKETGVDTNSPLRKMKLRGILDQTGSRVAIIDREVYRQGDEIEGYKIIEIGSDEVWFQGPRKKERLGLEKSVPRTNAFPRAVAPPVSRP
jgi:hypothetical protein